MGLSVNVLADQAHHQLIWLMDILFPHLYIMYRVLIIVK